MSLYLALIVIFIAFFGMNFTLWGGVSLASIIYNKFRKPQPRQITAHSIQKHEVAIIVPAHNEEMVIANTIEGALKILPASNIYIVTSDFPKKDRTADIARTYGVNVYEMPAPLAKASKLQQGIRYFNFFENYKAVLFVDADTILETNYLDKALPFFDEKEVSAVAGHATTLWEPSKNSWRNMFFLSYRERVYFFGQRIIKFGQSLKYINAMPIIPGFASVYRTNILEQINIDPGGLVIEDFNMTFELHHNNLGRIVYSPEVVAYTQDPDNLKDYFKQIKRWNLGFWQTVFRHGFWNSVFWSVLAFYIFEVCFSTIMFLLLPFYLVLIFLNFGLDLPYTYEVLVKAIFLTDYLLTCVMAVVTGRSQYFIYGLGFLFMRFVDSIAYMYSIPKAIFAKSTGAWTSPTRR